jgi:hypothetical protein
MRRRGRRLIVFSFLPVPRVLPPGWCVEVFVHCGRVFAAYMSKN